MKLNRRQFFGILGKAVVPLALLVQGFTYLKNLIPEILYEAPRRFKTKRPEKFPEGVSFIDDQRVFVVRERDKFHAISAVCPHLGCTVKLVLLQTPKKLRVKGKALEENWEFHCPCHGSKFYADGTNYAGPAPKPLEHYRVYLAPEDQRLMVDKGQEVRPDARLEVPGLA